MILVKLQFTSPQHHNLVVYREQARCWPCAMDPLELAKVFVKTVVRIFYDTEHVVVVDALVFHSMYA